MVSTNFRDIVEYYKNTPNVLVNIPVRWTINAEKQLMQLTDNTEQTYVCFFLVLEFLENLYFHASMHFNK